MRAILAALIACGCVSLVEAGEDRRMSREWEVYRAFLVAPACGLVPKNEMKACENALGLWRRDFKWATDPHWNKQYYGQQNVSICLATGCEGSVKPNPLLACAWARIVLLAGHPLTEQGDFQREEKYCSALGSDMERTTAQAQADRLLGILRSQ
jgi:hypothetical protein